MTCTLGLSVCLNRLQTGRQHCIKLFEMQFIENSRLIDFYTISFKDMPFTPFHLGPGAAIKAVAGRFFSLTVFGFAQVLIDLEPLIRILRHDKVLHGFTHTYLGALAIGLLALFLGKLVCRQLLKTWNRLLNFKYLRRLQVNPDISWLAASTGAVIGTVSHVFLDSIMHADMQPFWPFGHANGMLHCIPVAWLYLLCVVLGMLGLMTLLVVGLWSLWAIEID